MDTVKAEPYSDVPSNLEKGDPPVQPPHHDAEPCHGCSVHPIQARHHRFKRHLIAFGALAVIWLAYSYVRRAFNDRLHVWNWAINKVGPPPPQDEDYGQCVGSTNWTTYYDQPSWTPEYPYGAEASFSLPLDSDRLFLISRGAFQHGLVTIEQSKQVTDTVDLRVRVAYHDEQVLEHASVCQMQRVDEHGVGIFTPSWGPPHLPRCKLRNGLEFDVTLILPAGKEGSLAVKSLETNLPNYNQNVAHLGESALFDEISLTSANGRISVQSVTADIGQFWSVNGEIDGQFNSRSSLDLHTVNGRITSTVKMLHSEGSIPSYLKVRTINGQIDAEVSLTSESKTSTGGEFEVSVESIHGEVDLKFTETPVDSVLQCQAESIVGAVQVELDRAFEGTYSLQTLLGSKSVSQREVEDPAGSGRRRVISVNEARGRVEGEIKWEHKDGSSVANEGYVVLKALMPSLKLIV